MKSKSWIGCLVLCVAVSVAQTVVAGEAKTKKAAKKAAPNPALAPIKDTPGLPRVLLIGDSISIGYTTFTREALKGRANVHRIPANGGPTSNGLQNIDKWLGDTHWDVIHFNWGLHDLKIMEDGKHQVPLDQYEKNLRDLVGRLKKTGAKLIWASTTPVPEGKLNPPRSNADVIAYNAIAKKIMDENGVAIDDLYAFALPRLKEIQRPANVHFTAEGSKALAQQVAASILNALGKEKKK
ncbi:MAG: SGNH/GDSL hydrolase family protein [Candidatus Sumerlaeia bacterium]|nr:SGNH/GDSL hydrolase family protein [Candidatus Sumerlaeia bacterium]